jgi:hypothetical protein
LTIYNLEARVNAAKSAFEKCNEKICSI